MKKRPILFKGEMVRAILEGRKTMTRRLVKGVPDGNWNPKPPYSQGFMDGCWYPTSPSGKIGLVPPVKCPYGAPGDRLWVKETWAENPSKFASDANVVYKTDFPTGSFDSTHDTLEPWGTWKSPLFMPRCASRITLEIVSVRVERLNDLTEEDAEKEGLYQDYCGGGWRGESARSKFRTLWDSINGKTPGASWNDNPWVWVIEFERVTP